ncbi:MAG: TIGR00266 family protein [Leptotrichiaceae bacterium]
MNYKLSNDGAFPLVIVTLETGEEIKLESGAMVYHNGKVVLEGKMNSNGSTGFGGLLKAAARTMVSGEGFFITTAKGTAADSSIAIAPASIGGIKELNVGASKWCVNDGTFLACDSSVTYNMKRQSVGRALFAGTGGLFVMETSGEGTMLVNAFGDIIEIDLDGTAPFIVDNEHVVAWESTLQYNIKSASGIFGFKTGEGLVNEFVGKGKLYIQTRNTASLASLLRPFIATGK